MVNPRADSSSGGSPKANPSSATSSRRLARRLRELPDSDRDAVVAALRAATSRDIEPPAATTSASSEQPSVPDEEERRQRAVAPLSFAQERLWFLDRLDPGSASYNMKIAVQLDGPLDVDALRVAFDAVAERHAVLRTRYPDDVGRPHQVIEDPGPAPFEVVDLSGSEHRNSAAAARDFVAVEVARPFDLATGPVWRIRLIRLAASSHLLVIVIHHIAADGWSVPILTGEISELYAARVAGRKPNLPDLSLQYADYAREQRDQLAKGEFDEGLAYWSGKLARPLTANPLPTDRPRPAMQSSNGGRIDFDLSGVDPALIEQVSSQQRATASIVTLALFKAFLHRYSGAMDIIVGGPVTGRFHVETERLIGLFVNTLAYRTPITSEISFRDLVQSVRETAFEAYGHRDVPFERVVVEVNPERDPGRTPIFQVMFQYRAGVPRQGLELPGIIVEPSRSDVVASKFDLELELTSTTDQVRGSIVFNSDMYTEASVRRMMRHFSVMAGAALEDPDRPIGELPLMDAEEREHILAEYSGTMATPAQRTVLEDMARWVAQTPQSVAVSHGSLTVTYAALDRRARFIGAKLRERGVGRGDRVVISMARHPDSIAAILGVLHAGATYVPIDPTAPDKRIALIIEDASPAAILSDEPAYPGEAEVPLIVVSDIPDEDPPSIEDPPSLDDDAYVIYTSGTTGRPKGVVVTHRSLSAFAAAANRAYGIGGSDRLLQFHSLAFDASVEEVFCTLTAGATLVLLPDGTLSSVSRFLDDVARAGVTVLDLPTAFWHVLAAEVTAEDRPLSLRGLRLVIAGGEAIDPELVSRWKHRFDGSVELINSYGPTEATVAATMAVLSDLDDPGRAAVTVGMPFGSTRAYVVDPRGEPVPVGVAGELWIGGVQVAAGYLHARDLTDARFGADPFDPGSRIYRTGDLMRRRDDGNLIFLGRLDRQIKIRGFRIEPGEIESHLVRHEDVAVSFVHLREVNGDARLAAYVVPETGRTPTRGELVDYLRARVPNYMIPTIELVDEISTNRSGKVDVDLLPDPTIVATGEFEPPRGDAMIRMAAIWASVLGVDKIGADDRFFDLGGHSLLAVELITRVEREFHTAVPLATIFTAPSLSDFTRSIAHAEESRASDLVVPIRAEGSRSPVFCMPLSDGSVLAYQRLARHLTPDVPIIGIQARGADGRSRPHRTFEEMCREYAEVIMKTGPGPYRLLGASISGVLALETATHIVARGGEVDLVVMLDTVMPRSETWRNRLTRRLEVIRRGRGAGLALVGREAWNRARVPLGKIRHSPRWLIHEIRDKSLPSELASRRMTHVLLAAERAFQPSRYRGDVLYFRAADEGLLLREPPDRPWRDYTGRIDVVDSTGTHWGEESMLVEPHVGNVCAVMNERLAALDNEGDDG